MEKERQCLQNPLKQAHLSEQTFMECERHGQPFASRPIESLADIGDMVL